MKVKVEFTVDVPDEYRRAIRAYYGRDGMATRDEVRAWLRQYGTSMDDDLMWEARDRARDEDDDAEWTAEHGRGPVDLED